jgi:simple sugar transport system substrate-binding protein
MSAFAPKAHLGSCALAWGGYYEKAIGEALDKTWKTGAVKWGLKEGLVTFVKVPDSLPAPVRKKVEEAKAFLVANPGAVFRGPLVDTSGKEVLPRGAIGDESWKAKVDFYVKGVDGKVPSGG